MWNDANEEDLIIDILQTIRLWSNAKVIRLRKIRQGHARPLWMTFVSKDEVLTTLEKMDSDILRLRIFQGRMHKRLSNLQQLKSRWRRFWWIIVNVWIKRYVTQMSGLRCLSACVQMKLLKSSRKVVCHFVNYRANFRVCYVHYNYISLNSVVNNNLIQHSKIAVILRRRFVVRLQICRYTVKYLICEDFAMYNMTISRISVTWLFYLVPTFLVHFNVHFIREKHTYVI